MIRKIRGFIIITIVFIAIFIFMLPLRNQGFDDDFAYIHTAERYITSGHLKISEWAAVSTVFPVFWASLFANVLGFSIITLHFSSIVVVYLGTIAFYFLLKTIKIPEKLAVFFTFVYLAFPWVIQYTYTFMSDTFYLSLLSISLFFYTKGFSIKANKKYLLFGSFFAGLSYLSRQIGISLVLSSTFIVVYRAITSKKIKPNVTPLLCSLLPFFLISLIYHTWLQKTGLTAAQYINVLEPGRMAVNENILNFFSASKFSIVNRNLLEIFIQRLTSYSEIIAAFLIPSILVFNANLHEIYSAVKKNTKIICAGILAFFFLYASDNLTGSKFTSTPPFSRILSYSTVLDWAKYWKPLYLITTSILFILVVSFFKKILASFTVTKTKNSRALVVLSASSFGAFVLYFLFIIYRNNYFRFPNYFPVNHSGMGMVNAFVFNFSDFLPILFSKESALISLTIREGWFYFLILIFTTATIIILLTKRRLSSLPAKLLPLFFLGLTVVFELIATLFLAKYYWSSYILQFLPFLVIFIAYPFRSFHISSIRAVVYIILVLTFSLQIARTRYQRNGTEWEMATELVASGIQPERISVNEWAWRPYWYFEKTFDDLVKETGGNKYDASKVRLGSWSTSFPKGDIYEFTESPKADDIVISGPRSFRTFFEDHKLYIIKTQIK